VEPDFLRFTVDGLLPESGIGFEVTAKCSVGESDISRTVYYNTDVPPVPSKLAPPDLVDATWQSLSLAWNEPISYGTPITGYSLRWRLLEDDGSEAAGRGWQKEMYHRNERQLTIGRVTAAKKHRIGIVAHNKSGTSEEVFAVFTPPPTTPGKMLPVTLKSLATSQVVVQWLKGEPRGAEITNYVVTSEYNNQVYVQSIPAEDSRSCTIPHLNPDSTVHVSICAENSVGKGEESSTGTFVTLPPQPPLQMDPPTLHKISHNSLSLKWEAPMEDGVPVTGYILKLITGSSDGKNMKVAAEVETDAATMETTFDGLKEFTQYVAIAQADSVAGRSKPSKPVAFQTTQEYPVPFAQIVQIVEAMKDVLRGDVQEWGCKSLMDIASAHEEWVTAVAQLGAVPRIVRAMFSYPKSVSIHSYGGRCLRTLCDPRIPDAGLLSIKANTEVYDLLLQMRNAPWRADTQGVAKFIVTQYDEQYPRYPRVPATIAKPKQPYPTEPAQDRMNRQLGEALDNDPRHLLAKFEQGADLEVGRVGQSAWEAIS